ncbi:MAG: hypothetical protein ACR2RV_04505 [Verrucomicrobiales bacterium]
MRTLVIILLSVAILPVARGYEIFDILTGTSASASRAKDWKPADGIPLEVGGMTWIGPDRLAVAIRKGEVWMIDGVLSDSREDLKFTRFASGLHEPLGLLRDGDDLLVAQRSEVTRLRDRDGDGQADSYLREASGWAVTGNYHAYTYGPERDGEGELWVTLNVGMGERANNDLGWHGWGGTIGEAGKFLPQAMGMRSPSGLSANASGDMFFSDQQGSWVPATPIYHLRRGAFYGNQEALATLDLPAASPVEMATPPPAGVPYPEALRSTVAFVPPAVWLPYNKMGRSATDLELIDCAGKFGPFDGQFLVGEFTNSGINRVFLEKVGGEYQGACFPFLDGFPAAVLRLKFAPDGSLFVGMTNRGWSSLGNRSYGLQRVRLEGEVPFSVREMRALSDGFELSFTEPVDATTAVPGSFSMGSFTYHYSSAYGGDEIDLRRLPISSVDVGDDGMSLRLKIVGLRELYVHELHLDGLRSARGGKLAHPRGFYTLNQIPASD